MEAFSVQSLTATAIPSSLTRRESTEKPSGHVNLSKYSHFMRNPCTTKHKLRSTRVQASGSTKSSTGSAEVIPEKTDSKDDNLVFVAGATGRVGSRTVRELISLVLESELGCVMLRELSVEQLKLDATSASGGSQAVEKLEIVECDLEKPDQIGSALGNASTVICSIGASEKEVFDITGPFRIDYQATKNLIDAATVAKVNHFILVTSLGTNKIGFPAAILNLFWGVLVWKRKAEEALLASGLPYTIVRPGGMERPTDAYKETHNITLSTEDTLFGGQVSNLQNVNNALFGSSHDSHPDIGAKAVSDYIQPTFLLFSLLFITSLVHKFYFYIVLLLNSWQSWPRIAISPIVNSGSNCRDNCTTDSYGRTSSKDTFSTALHLFTQVNFSCLSVKLPWFAIGICLHVQEEIDLPTREPVIAAVNDPDPSADVMATEPDIATEKETAPPKPMAKQTLSPYLYDDLKPPSSPSPAQPSGGKQIKISDAVPTPSASETPSSVPGIDGISQTTPSSKGPKSLSPYAAYEDLKPPTSPSPTPSSSNDKPLTASTSVEFASSSTGEDVAEKYPSQDSNSSNSPYPA
ncbi:hypothetical protein SESBI_21913 [Sesbania bispinosa]|nr:hypothetical protein SESBI_21913 [Sesbania bispinosa]